VLAVLLIVVGLLAPLLSPYEPTAFSENTLQGPTSQHWLGTNDLGQDIWSRVLFGTRTSLINAFFVAIITVTLAAALGGSAALIGGLYERFILRIIDILLIIPNIVLIIVIAAYLRPGIVMLILILSVFDWPGCARIIRSQTLILKGKAHILAAKTFGGGDLYILFKHIIPDLSPILMSSFIAHARRAVFMEAGLAFLGIADPAMVSWGIIINRALQYSYLSVWYWIIPPALGLAVMVTAFSYVGYALEEIINPRLKV